MTIGRAGQAQPRKGDQPHAQRVRPCLILINGGKRDHTTMTVKDLVALANAGFSAAQIAAINTAMSAEAQAPAQTPPPATAQTATPAQTPPTSPAQTTTPAPAPDQTAEILKQLGIISGQISAANIGNTQQPAQQTADDILAAIIAPPAKE